MAHAAKHHKPADVEPDDESRHAPDEEPVRVLELEFAEAGGFAKATKTEAVRIALSEGLDSPDEIQAFVRAKFGHDMTKAHITSYKSRLGGAKKQATKPEPAW